MDTVIVYAEARRKAGDSSQHVSLIKEKRWGFISYKEFRAGVTEDKRDLFYCRVN